MSTGPWRVRYRRDGSFSPDLRSKDEAISLACGQLWAPTDNPVDAVVGPNGEVVERAELETICKNRPGGKRE